MKSHIHKVWYTWEALIGFLLKPIFLVGQRKHHPATKLYSYKRTNVHDATSNQGSIVSYLLWSLRKRKLLLLSLTFIALGLPIIYITLKYLSPVQAAWHDDNYSYRQKITFGNTGSADSDKKVKLDIDTASLTTDKMQADCDDTRFTNINGRVLQFYLDSSGGACDTTSTDYYVRIPTINTGDNIIYIYYGNPAATNGGQSAQFSQATFTPTSGPTLASEEKAPSPAGYWKFDEGYGTTAQDSTTNNNDGTISGATWVEESRCVSGKCLQFDGSDDYVSVADNSLLQLGSSFTVGAWVKSNKAGTSYTTSPSIIAKEEAGNLGWNLRINYTDGKFTWVANDTNSYQSTSTVSGNTWYYVSVTYDSTSDTIKVYVNGKEESSTTYTNHTVSTVSLNIGRSPRYTTRLLQGFIDEVKIYPYARSAAEIKQDFLKGAAGAGSSAVLGASDTSALSNGLVGYWKMDEASANTCTGGINDSCDSSGNANDGAWNGNAANAAGKFGNGTTYDGVGDYLSVGSNFALDEITVSGWIKADTITGESTPIIQGHPDSATSWGLDLRSNTLFFYLDDDGQWGPDAALTMTTSPSTGVWYHTAFTYSKSAGIFKVFLDGTQIDSTTTFLSSLYSTFNLSNETDKFKTGGSNNNYFFDGTIDDVRIYNRALSPAEVRQLYAFAPGPVGHWKMDEASWTNDCATDSVFDTSGNANHGDACPNSTGPTGGAVGRFGKAGSFDGSSAFVSVGTDSLLDITSAITVEAWVKPDVASQTNFAEIFGRIGGVNWSGYELQLDNSSPNKFRIRIANSSTTTNLDSTTALIADTWFHVTATYDSSSTTCKIFVNGIEENSNTSCVTLGSAGSVNPLIGKNPSNTFYWDGKIDDVRIYNYARTQAQIAQDYNRGRPVAHWNFDECEGSTVYSQPSSPMATSNDPNLNGTITIGSFGSQTAVGNCTSGNSAHAWNNGATGKFNASLDFDGTDDYVDIGDPSSALDLNTNGFTASMWLFSDSGATSDIPLAKGAGSTSNEYFFFLDTSGKIKFGGHNTSNSEQNSGVSSTDIRNAWHHVVGIYDGTNFVIYIDGKQENSTASSGSLKSDQGDLEIGRQTTGANYWAGQIDDVRIYNYPLSAAQIRNVYNGGSAVRFGPSQGSP